jgi:predicted phosphodiesterase
MTIAALYDIHGNLPALQAVLDELRRSHVTQVLVGGDVLPGPMPRECLAVLRDLDVPTRFIRGNGERVVLTARGGGDISGEVPEPFRDVIRWTAAQIDNDMADWIATWPPVARLPRATGGDILFCHATPRNDTDIFTRLTPADRLRAIFAGANAALVVCGHTHMQFDRWIGDTRVVNAGSVGMSFQGPGAFWLEIDSTPRLRRLEYETRRAAVRVEATTYPQAAAFARDNVLHPPDEATMLERFSLVTLPT